LAFLNTSSSFFLLFWNRFDILIGIISYLL
jgi:hypothetical protein